MGGREEEKLHHEGGKGVDRRQGRFGGGGQGLCLGETDRKDL